MGNSGDFLMELNTGEEFIQSLKKLEKELDEHAMALISIKSEMAKLSSSMLEKAQKNDKIINNPKRSLERIILRIIRVLDSFDETSQADPHFLQSQLKEILNREGVMSFYPGVGKVFNPLMHEVMGKIENNELEEGTIIKVHNYGYKTDSKVIRRSEVDISVKS